MRTEPTVSVLDATGCPMDIGSIVTVSGVSGYTGLEGLVVETRAATEEGPLAVAVYFDREIKILSQDEKHLIPRHVWDTEYAPQCPDALFTLGPSGKEYVWQQCYRVRYFFPHHLRTINFWSVETLVKRTFPGAQSWRTPVDRDRIDTGMRNDLPCGIEGCVCFPSRLALVSVHGIVRVFNTCYACYERYHGQIRTTLPPLRKHEDAHVVY